MKTLIVYYSLEGNTEYTAQQIAETMGADLLCLKPVKAYPTGKVSKFVWGGKSAVMSETPELKPYSCDAAAYDCIVFGFPVWASTIAPPLRTFIRSQDLKGKRIAAFACQTAAGADKAFVKLKGELGLDALEAELTLLDPKTKPNPENEQKIRDFCAALKG
ncbi:MAG: flavodoxin [Oscillospiraceae bacterium]|nr:flavodoxin [Oscillospiraceae bacterium]